MLENIFEELKNRYGNDVVSFDGEVYDFCMNDKLMEMDSEEWNEYEKIEKEVDNVGGLWGLGYGDDVINMVSFKSLTDINENVEKFIIKWVGRNCYCE